MWDQINLISIIGSIMENIESKKARKVTASNENLDFMARDFFIFKYVKVLTLDFKVRHFGCDTISTV